MLFQIIHGGIDLKCFLFRVDDYFSQIALHVEYLARTDPDMIGFRVEKKSLLISMLFTFCRGHFKNLLKFLFIQGL